LYEVYARAKPDYTGAVTVPVLWDKQRGTIVNNESAEIIRMLESAFDEWGDAALDLYPAALRGQIDAFNDRLYGAVNNGVYKAGFATGQDAYEDAVRTLFAMLDEIEQRLEGRRYLFGDALTEPDVRLFTTAIRFDLVYYSHFKCNIRQWRDYPRLQAWLRDVYAVPGVAETVDLAQIKRHYYHSQTWVNPSGIVPLGPTINLAAPHGRG
jgi:putative glutathione S-transferase